MYQNGKNITIIDHNVNCVEAIEAELRKRKPLTEEQEHELCRRMQEGDKRACDRLVEGNMRYAMRVAKQYLPSGAALEDLFQAGCEGLVKAAHKFDATLGYHFIRLHQPRPRLPRRVGGQGRCRGPHASQLHLWPYHRDCRLEPPLP